METTRRKRGTKAKTHHADPRIQELADQIEAAMGDAKYSQAKLASASGVDQSHLSKWFRGEAGLSIEQILNLFQALGLGWGMKRGDVGDPRNISIAGTIDKHGAVTLLGGAPIMPAVFLIEGDQGPFKAGDRALYEAGEWTDGKWVMVKHPDGRNRVHKCELRNGMRLLVGDEEVIFNEARHEVVGVIDARVERM